VSESPRSETARLAIGGLIVAIVACWVATGISGCQVGEADRPSAESRVRTAVGSFSVPNGLLVAAAPAGALGALGITEVRAYAPGGDPSQGSVVIGSSMGTGATLLGAGAARLAGASTPRVQEVNGDVAVHVTGRVAGRQASVYSLPTDAGEAVVLCLGGEADAPVDQRDCVAVASTLSISAEYGRPISLRAVAAYPAQLATALGDYLQRAPRLRRELRLARYADEQASAAGRLAAACRVAASALARLAPTPIALPAQYALERELGQAGGAYDLLRSAARGGEHGLWAASRARVASAERRLRESLASALAQ
jgi:hypothetical protein